MARKKEIGWVGKTENGRLIRSGRDVFNWMSRDGLPFEVIEDSLRQNNAGFSVPEFINAARENNWPEKTIKRFVIHNFESQKAIELALKYIDLAG